MLRPLRAGPLGDLNRKGTAVFFRRRPYGDEDDRRQAGHDGEDDGPGRLGFLLFRRHANRSWRMAGRVSNWVRKSSPGDGDSDSDGGARPDVSTAAGIAGSLRRQPLAQLRVVTGLLGGVEQTDPGGCHLVKQLLGPGGVLARVEPLQVGHPLVGGVLDHLGVGLEQFDGQQAVMMDRPIPGRNAKPLEVGVEGFAQGISLLWGQQPLL